MLQPTPTYANLTPYTQNEGGEMKYEHKCAQPELPPNAESPVMTHRQMEEWLNKMATYGWEFIGYAQKHWRGAEPFVQDWWIFRRPTK